jgi:ParB family chromosome partitioning protein
MAKKKFNFNSVTRIKTESDVDSKDLIKNSMESLGISSNIVRLQPQKIANWVYRDRSEFELGDIDHLADSIRTKGQAQPIVVVLASDNFKAKEDRNATYIVIAGYRRWLACLKHDIKVDAIIKDLMFDDAIALLDAENEKESVSEYSKGIFYHSLISSGEITRDALKLRLSLKSASLSNLLSFGDIPSEIWNAVGDMSKVSSRTASVLRSFINKNESYINKIINIADKIRSGSGEKVITKLLNINPDEQNCVVKSDNFMIGDRIICNFTNRGLVFNKTVNSQDIETINTKIKSILSKYYEK